MIFKDIVPASLYEKIDPNLKDAKGYNAEIGCRGKYDFLQWDITGFILQYNNRFGTLGFTDSSGNFYTYRTNIGNSLTKGIEVFLQGNWIINNKINMSIFTSTSLMDGRYISGSIKTGNTIVSIKGNKIESVPNVISRNGITFQYSKFSITGQYSYTSKTYADAINTESPNETGSIGIVPSYGIIDLNATYKFSKNIELKANIKNLTSKQYFTKRPLFYPGPGIWSSDGRNGTISIIVRI
jgi:Fe(3+) dicitrate transport protein